jgi:hypothetical protein
MIADSCHWWEHIKIRSCSDEQSGLGQVRGVISTGGVFDRLQVPMIPMTPLVLNL